MATDKKQVTVRFSEAMYNDLVLEASAQNRSLANYLEVIILSSRVEWTLTASREQPWSEPIPTKPASRVGLKDDGRRVRQVR